MGENLDYAKIFGQFPLNLRRFLKHRLTIEDAKRIVRHRMAHRDENFLNMVKRNVYGLPTSPYLALLKHARCEFGDVQALVRDNGVEGALLKLREQGVYVTFEEFKGRKPIRRNGLHLNTHASDFDNPFSRTDLSSSSSGTTGAAVKVAIDFDYIAARASNRMVALDVYGLLGAPMALWRGILPDRTMSQVLFGALTNQLPGKWFSPVGMRQSKHWLKYGLGTYYLVGWMRALGVHTPFPEYVSEENSLVVARWGAEMVKQQGRCILRTGTSRGVRLCQAAYDAGVDLRGVTFMAAGEPATEAKEKQFTRVGARFISNYGMSEAGQPGAGCANRVGISDYHLMKDACAIFSYPYDVESFDLTVPAFNMTTILPGAPKVMLNVQTDDFGIVEERHCGCGLEEYGYTTHLREIRSYSKLTGEGVTLIGQEMVKILEQDLPGRFGGSMFDYQLMEEEDSRGQTRLYLIISPRVEISDENQVIDFMHNALRNSSPAADAARMLWQNAKTIQLKRMEPIWGNRGKFQSLYLPQRYKATSPLPTAGQR